MSNLKDLSERIQDDIDCCLDAQLYGYIDAVTICQITTLVQQIVVDRIKEHETGN